MQGIFADGLYNHEPYDVRPADYITPPNTWEQRLISLAQASVTMPRGDVRRIYSHPLLPQINHTVPPVGVPTVQDVLAIGRDQINFDARWAGYSGSASGYSAASRNTMGNGMGA